MAINWTEIDRIAKAQRLIDPLLNEAALLQQLRVWWCVKYSRPFKDPLLKEYSLDELIYEFLCHFYSEPDNDPAQEKRAKQLKTADDAWVAEQMAKMRLDEQKKKAVQAAPVPKEEPPLAPDLPEISTMFDE